MSETPFDLVIIGSGPAGYTGAIRAAQLGMKTACIEKDKPLGGTCLNVGCIPSKALLDSSEHYLHAKKKLEGHGILVSDVKLDVPAMIARKNKVVKELTSGIEGLFKKNKITRFVGRGKIGALPAADLKTVEIYSEKGRETIQTKRILIATGSVPNSLPTLPFDGKKILSSTEALDIQQVPKHLVVVGGGVIGLEMGSVWLRLGAKVTVVEFQNQFLGAMDQQVAKELHRSLVKQGMEFRFGTKCLGAKIQGNTVLLETEETATNAKNTIECDLVLVSTGRVPYTQGLGLQEGGFGLDAQGRVEINDHFETKVPNIYAVGDVVRGPMLAHKAEEEAVAAVEIMAGQAGHVNYNTIPGVVYTWPEFAYVGLTEEQVKTKGIEYNVGTMPFLANGRAKAMDEKEGLVKIIADKKTDRVLGVHIFGPRASDMISEAVAVMEFGGSAEDIARTCHAHPTLSEAFKEAALDVAKRRINL